MCYENDVVALRMKIFNKFGKSDLERNTSRAVYRSETLRVSQSLQALLETLVSAKQYMHRNNFFHSKLRSENVISYENIQIFAIVGVELQLGNNEL